MPEKLGVSVTVYGQQGCGDCLAVQTIFGQKKIPFEYIEGDQATKRVEKICEALDPTRKAFPVITVDIKSGPINTSIAVIEPRGLALSLFAGMLQGLQILNKSR